MRADYCRTSLMSGSEFGFQTVCERFGFVCKNMIISDLNVLKDEDCFRGFCVVSL